MTPTLNISQYSHRLDSFLEDSAFYKPVSLISRLTQALGVITVATRLNTSKSSVFQTHLKLLFNCYFCSGHNNYMKVLKQLFLSDPPKMLMVHKFPRQPHITGCNSRKMLDGACPQGTHLLCTLGICVLCHIMLSMQGT